MRIARKVGAAWPQLCPFEGGGGGFMAFRRCANAVDQEGLLHRTANREARIERGKRVLEHHLDCPTRPALGFRPHHKSVHHDLAGGGSLQPDQKVGERALATTTFSGDA